MIRDYPAHAVVAILVGFDNMAFCVCAAFVDYFQLYTATALSPEGIKLLRQGLLARFI